jgi:hypothetical protein
MCGADTKADWSNKSGDYRMELDDWQKLCWQCHRQYDSQPHMRGAAWKVGASKGFIEVTEKKFIEAEELRRLIAIYKAKHGLPTMFEALAEIVESATMDGCRAEL